MKRVRNEGTSACGFVYMFAMPFSCANTTHFTALQFIIKKY